MNAPHLPGAAARARQQAGGRRPLPGEERTPRSLEEALRCGPFHAALRLAIAQSGLNLDSLRRRLLAEGHAVSLSTLSYWQRGERRPERPGSVSAVHALERILGVRRSGLVALLGPPRPRGRGARRPAPPLRFEEALGPRPSLAAMLGDLDAAAVNTRVGHVSMHNDRHFGHDREWKCDRVRRVVTALQDGVDRFVAISVPDTEHEAAPTIRPLSGCRLGRVRTDFSAGVRAAELIFEMPLRAGQRHVFEYECNAGAGSEGITSWLVCARYPVRELIMRAHFPPQALPARCDHIHRDRHDAPIRELGELPVSASGTVNLVALDVAPGLEGLRWVWE